MSRLRLATRGSALAREQARRAAAALAALDPELAIETVIVRTSGDASQVPFHAMSTVGVFVKEIEETLERGEADLAVHSLKDLPTIERAGLTVAATLEREDPRDALISRSGAGLMGLPPGARVATSSPRRRILLAQTRPDLRFVEARGNVDTRLRKLAGGEFDALVLALAGLRRLGRDGEVSEVLAADVLLPAPGQGAIALQAGTGSWAAELAARLDHPPTRAAVDAERSFLLALGGGCSLPVGALAEVLGDELRIEGVLAEPLGGRIARARLSGPLADPAGLGRRLAAEVRRAGDGARGHTGGVAAPLARRRIVVTQAADTAAALVGELRALGADVLACPAIVVAPARDPAELARVLADADGFAVVCLTSPSAVQAIAAGLAAGPARRARFAVVGETTAAALRRLGVEPDLVAEEATGEGLAHALLTKLSPGARVLFPRARDASRALPERLAAGGIEVVEVEAYRTEPPADLPASLARACEAGPTDAVVFASPSAVRNVLAAASAEVRRRLLEGAAIACIGPTTAEAAVSAGLPVDVRPARPASAEMAAELVRHFNRR